MPDPLKLLAFVPNLGSGGAEMHLMRLLNNIDRTRIEPLLAVVRPGGNYEARLADDVRVYHCTKNIRSSLLSMYAAQPKLRKILKQEQPDIVFSVLEYASVAIRQALEATGHKAVFVAGIQNNFSASLKKLKLPLSIWYPAKFRQMYANADHIIALSQGVASDLATQVKATENKTTVIYNAGYEPDIVRLAEEPLERKRPEGNLLIACGRLNEQKDYPTLLRAFASLVKDTEATLWILGTGPHESQLKELAAQLTITDRVEFLGFQNNPFKYMAAADLFVLSSAWEGFGNVVVEALALGLPVVSTDCPYGPAEILDHGRYGSLVKVGDDSALAAALKSTLGETAQQSSAERIHRQERAREFDAGLVAQSYTETFVDCFQKK